MDIVWFVCPLRRERDVWYSSEVTRPTITLRAGDILDGGVVVPGFIHPVAELFDLLWASVDLLASDGASALHGTSVGGATRQ